MTEKIIELVNDDNNSDKVFINISILEIISAITTNDVEDVKLRSKLSTKAQEIILKKVISKGVQIKTSNKILSIDVYIDIKYGINVVKICNMIQINIIEQILAMTGLSVKTVNVHIKGINSLK